MCESTTDTDQAQATFGRYAETPYDQMTSEQQELYSWPSTTSGTRRLRPGTVKPWSSLIARARKSGVDSPGACRAPGWHGVRWSSAAKLNRPGHSQHVESRLPHRTATAR
jgi:hypothetical protein